MGLEYFDTQKDLRNVLESAVWIPEAFETGEGRV